MISEIVPRLFVGQLEDAAEFDGVVICVLETRTTSKQAIHVPILDPDPVQGVRANLGQLSQVKVLIFLLRKLGQRILVHCGAGIERSPLAVAWYLHQVEGMSLDEAYRLLQEKRPVVQDRRNWLPAPEQAPGQEGR